MRKLVRTITAELETADHCAVYQSELVRVWPTNGDQRRKAIMQFAQQHHWRLRFYKDGFMAIFDKEPAGDQPRFRGKMPPKIP